MSRHQTLRVSEALRRALAIYRVNHEMFGAPVVERSVLRRIEEALGVRIPEPVVATLASMERDLHQVQVLTEDARELGMPGDLLAFAEERDDRLFWCVRAGAAAGDVRAFSWASCITSEVLLLSEWVWARAGRKRTPDLEFEEVYDTLVPRIRLNDEPSDRRRVIHAKFGEGVVVEARHDGRQKLRVDFGARGQRWVLARFVSDAPRRPPGSLRRTA